METVQINKRVVIWGVTPVGKYLITNLFDKDENIRPFAFVDNNSKLQNSLVDGIPVVSYQELTGKRDLRKTVILLAVKNAKNIFQILEQLKNMDVESIGIVKPSVLLSKAHVNISEESGNIIWNVFKGKEYKIVPRIEVNLIDACNLKCKGCTHFSSIYMEDSVYPLDEYREDLLQLRAIGKILRLRLLGGEPFLLNNLNVYIEIARNIFQESDIEIVTNGLLVPAVNEEIMSAIKENNISVIISAYRPTLQKKEQIVEKLEQYGIWWQFEEEITCFSRNFTLQKVHNAEISNRECLSAGCSFLRKGKIYKCPFDGLINDFYRYYEVEKSHKGGIELCLDKNILYEKLVDYALKPIELCAYCAEKPESIPWSVKADPSLQDWLYKDGC